MKISTLLFTACFFFVCLFPRAGQPCTTFCLDKGDQPVFGRNFDWSIGDALVITNKRNVSKTAMVNNEETGISQPVSWTSQFGSVTFNYVCRELPMGGMNEAGLVVECMILFATEYPAPDSRPYIGSLQWMQYQLDNFSTVEQVIASDSQLRIRGIPDDPGIHFLVSDKMGNCASIEFIDGKLVYHIGETMPVKTLTNSIYANSVAFLYEHSGWGGDLPLPQNEGSFDRFVRAADMVRNYDLETSGSAVEYAFDVLANVAQRSTTTPTQWSIVYDIQNLRIYFRTLENEQIRYLNFSSFEFSCITPVKVLDANADLSGDVSSNFIDYTYEINRDQIEKGSPDISDEGLDFLAEYPETTVCTAVDCFIASAAYGSMMEPQVKVLREFRDRFLLDNRPGKFFIHLYNTCSPPLANFIAGHDSLRAAVRLGLLPIVCVSWITLKLGPLPALLFILVLLALISTTTAILFRKMRLRLH